MVGWCHKRAQVLVVFLGGGKTGAAPPRRSRARARQSQRHTRPRFLIFLSLSHNHLGLVVMVHTCGIALSLSVALSDDATIDPFVCFVFLFLGVKKNLSCLSCLPLQPASSDPASDPLPLASLCLYLWLLSLCYLCRSFFIAHLRRGDAASASSSTCRCWCW